MPLIANQIHIFKKNKNFRGEASEMTIEIDELSRPVSLGVRLIDDPK